MSYAWQWGYRVQQNVYLKYFRIVEIYMLNKYKNEYISFCKELK